MCVQKNPKRPHKHKINHHLPYKHLHLLKKRTWRAQEEEDEDQDDEPPQEEDIDQGEMKMNKTMKMIKKFGIKDHHTQVSTKQFKEITPSTPFLVTFTRGND
jgi:ATP adenylyltransferase/5',5'''-P-1,P-4-tetraphosphate phosphorylase II